MNIIHQIILMTLLISLSFATFANDYTVRHPSNIPDDTPFPLPPIPVEPVDGAGPVLSRPGSASVITGRHSSNVPDDTAFPLPPIPVEPVDGAGPVLSRPGSASVITARHSSNVPDDTAFPLPPIPVEPVSRRESPTPAMNILAYPSDPEVPFQIPGLPSSDNEFPVSRSDAAVTAVTLSASRPNVAPSGNGAISIAFTACCRERVSGGGFANYTSTYGAAGTHRQALDAAITLRRASTLDTDWLATVSATIAFSRNGEPYAVCRLETTAYGGHATLYLTIESVGGLVELANGSCDVDLEREGVQYGVPQLERNDEVALSLAGA